MSKEEQSCVNCIKYDAIDPETEVMVTFYNRTKIGIDLVNQMYRSCDVARNSRRWPVLILYDLLNISAINAFFAYKANKPENTTQGLKFNEYFGWELMRPQIQFK